MGKWLRAIAFGGLVAVAGLMFMSPAFASVIAEKTDGTQLDDAHRIRGALRMNNNVAILGEEICIPFDPGEFVGINAARTVATQLTSATTPTLSMKNSLINVTWLDNMDSPIQKTFKVPSNYDSNGYFKVTVGRSGTGNPPAIDFDVYLNRTLTAFDAAATNQTAVQVTNAISTGSPEQKTLTVTTDFASLAAGDDVTWSVWRDNVNTSTDNLEFYGGSFCYTIAN